MIKFCLKVTIPELAACQAGKVVKGFRSREGQVGFLAFFSPEGQTLDSLPAQIGVLATSLVNKWKQLFDEYVDHNRRQDEEKLESSHQQRGVGQVCLNL